MTSTSFCGEGHHSALQSGYVCSLGEGVCCLPGVLTRTHTSLKDSPELRAFCASLKTHKKSSDTPHKLTGEKWVCFCVREEPLLRRSKESITCQRQGKSLYRSWGWNWFPRSDLYPHISWGIFTYPRWSLSLKDHCYKRHGGVSGLWVATSSTALKCSGCWNAPFPLSEVWEVSFLKVAVGLSSVIRELR